MKLEQPQIKKLEKMFQDIANATDAQFPNAGVEEFNNAWKNEIEFFKESEQYMLLQSFNRKKHVIIQIIRKRTQLDGLVKNITQYVLVPKKYAMKALILGSLPS